MRASVWRTDGSREGRQRTALARALAILTLVSWSVGIMPAHLPTARANEVAVDFENVDLRVFIKFVSEATGKVFLLDDRVRGAVSVRFTNKIPVEQLHEVLESVLEVKGFAAIPAGPVIKIVPLGTAKQRGIEVQGSGPPRAGQH